MLGIFLAMLRSSIIAINIICLITYCGDCYINEDIRDVWYIQNKVYKYYEERDVKEEVCNIMSKLITPFILPFMCLLFFNYLPRYLNDKFCEYFKKDK